MMLAKSFFFFLLSTICLFSFNDSASTPENNNKLIIRGRVTFSGSAKTVIEPGSKLNIELQDTSLADAPAKVIAKGTGSAKRFPMAFTIRYSPSQIQKGHTYSLSVSIRNKQNDLLYINDMHIPIVPVGNTRTKFVTVPVINVKPTPSKPKKSKWPELVGKKGTDAAKIIKKETGFTNVVVLYENSAITMDLRTDRVRIFVNNSGIVIRVPTIA